MRELAFCASPVYASVSEARGRVTAAPARKSLWTSRALTAEPTHSTFDLLIAAAGTLGARPVRVGKRSFRLAGVRNLRVHWPPRPDPSKSSLPKLVRASQCRVVAGCPTQSPNFDQQPPWLPCCLKPDRGTRGRGFRIVTTVSQWRKTGRGERNTPLVVQPLIEGTEYRVTLLFDGTYDCSRLVSRTGRVTEWIASSPRLPLVDLHKLLRKLKVPGAGFDLIRVRTSWYLLDCNLSPSLKMHAASSSNLNRLARAYIRSAVLLFAHEKADGANAAA
jgi:hypothetical protein